MNTTVLALLILAIYCVRFMYSSYWVSVIVKKVEYRSQQTVLKIVSFYFKTFNMIQGQNTSDHYLNYFTKVLVE